MNHEAEKAVIGILLMDNSEIKQIYGQISPEMFGDSMLGKIFYEIKAGYDKGYGVDIAVLESKISSEDIPKTIFLETLQEIIQYSPLSYELKNYAKIIKNEYRVKQANKIFSEIKLNSDEINNQLLEISASLDMLMSEQQYSTQSIAEIIDEYAPTKFNDLRPDGVKLGIGRLDEMVDLDPGDICIIAARPSVGKSVMAKQIAFNLARQGLKTEMFILEMTKEQTYDRMAATESGIELKRLRRAKAFLDDEKERFEKANERLRSLGDKLLINDNIYKVSEMLVDMKRNKVDVGIIDYAQLIKPESNYKGNRYAEVGAISHSLKEAAKKLQIPLIVLAQLNRTSEKTKDKEPSMSDLRESGDFEQDASVIILLWNMDEEDRTIKGMKIDKNRNDKLGKYELTLNVSTMCFEDNEGFRPAPINSETPWQ